MFRNQKTKQNQQHNLLAKANKIPLSKHFPQSYQHFNRLIAKKASRA